ncbi:MAG TPA: hypothetical protein VFW66_11440 [Gemmatimonadales bacterium]|nr:hypothetical protein [Gemmatimonadales bacterium]
MHRPPVALITAVLVTAVLAAGGACGNYRAVAATDTGDSDGGGGAPTPQAAPLPAPAPSYAKQQSLDVCRRQVARRWSVADSAVRSTSRGYDASNGTDLVNWEVPSRASGYCRVDSLGTVLQLATERTYAGPAPAARDSAPALAGDTAAPAPAAPGAAAGAGGADTSTASADLVSRQLDACRAAVVSRLRVGPAEVGLSAGSPDTRGTVTIEWSLSSGQQGTCVMNSAGAVARFTGP